MRQQLLMAIKSAGVVGAGGAGFPTHAKMDAKVELIIANGAECEPLLRVDQQLMAVFPDEVVKGIRIAMEITGAGKAVIALKHKYKPAIEALTKAIRGKSDISLFELDSFYPAGDEQVLVHEVTGRTVPEGGIPLAVGVVVSNVNTLINISRAIEGLPVISRYLTITGAVKTPRTIHVPIGAPVRKAIELAGGATVSRFEVINGGPMMGKLVSSLDEPITKTTSGLIVLPEDHPRLVYFRKNLNANIRHTQAACIRCSFCTQMCPRNLLGHAIAPDKVMRSVAHGNPVSPTDITSAFLCCECNVCTLWACPMGLDPCRMNITMKEEMRKKGIRNPHSKSDLVSSPFREERKVPTERLIMRLGLQKYDQPAPLSTQLEKVERVVIPLKQHIGSPAEPCVKAGETVRAGQLIGKAMEGGLSANIHASISGIVEGITSTAVIIKATEV